MAIPSEIEEKIKKFDENRNFKNSKPKHIELAEQEREKFVTAFPKEKFREIKLENYAPGKQPLDTNTWSYLNEFGSKNFGENGGGQADKFGVYMIGKEGPHKGKWEWAGRSLEKGTNNSDFETVEEAFKDSISVIGDCLDAAEDHIKINNWKKLSQVFDERVELNKYSPTPLVITKAIVMYYPEHFPFEWGHIHLNKVLDLFEINRKDLPEGVQSKRGSFYLKIGRLVDFKNNHPIMKEWSFYYLRAFLEEFDFGVKNTGGTQGKVNLPSSSSSSSMSNTTNTNNPHEMLYWPYIQFQKWKPTQIVVLGKKLVDLDGKDIDQETQKFFLKIFQTSGFMESTISVDNMTDQDITRKWQSATTFLTRHGLASLQNNKFKISKFTKYYLANKKDIKGFAIHVGLRMQYPNFTMKQSHIDTFNSHQPQIAVFPLVLLLKVLLRLAERDIKNAYLTEYEICALIFQLTEKVADVEDIVGIINQQREQDATTRKNYYLKMLKKFPDAKYNQGYTGTSRTDSISRSFPFFEATGLIELKTEKRPIINAANELVTDLEDESDGDKSKIYLVPEQIESVRYLLEKFDPFLIYDQDNKVDWENYHGGNNIE